MPELPEVETIRRELSIHMIGRTIQNVRIEYDGLLRNISKEDFQNQLRGKTIQSLHRRGKYLFISFGDLVLIIHLRMEGRFLFRQIADPLEKHQHVAFDFEDGMSLRYHDTRKFGTMELRHSLDTMNAQGVNSLAKEPLDEDFSYLDIVQKIRSSKRPIKSILLDQSVIAGLGNIYVDEVLFLSKIKPTRKGINVLVREVKDIANNAKIVLQRAVELGGSSIRTYTSSLGVDGRFQNELNVHMQQGQPCPVCGSIIEKTKVGGRGTYFCPVCQKK